MRWENVRKQFPGKWVVLEAVKAYSDNGYRHIEEVNVMDIFDDSIGAMQCYNELHKLDPYHEYCFFHTSPPALVAREKYVGLRRYG